MVGIDLVHAQLRVASGEPLPFTQDSLSQRGHAIECRIYAEDPAQGFLPQAGPILLYREPQGPGIRVDSGVREGSEVSVHYDPMLAKLIVHAATREEARRRAITALARLRDPRDRTNIPFLLQILEHPQFVNAAIDTGFLDREACKRWPRRFRQDDRRGSARSLDHQHDALGTPGTRWHPWNLILSTSEVGVADGVDVGDGGISSDGDAVASPWPRADARGSSRRPSRRSSRQPPAAAREARRRWRDVADAGDRRRDQRRCRAEPSAKARR